ncbi:MAG: TIGR01458 family HAD-type hydrolase [Candidatus Krumholzibacteriia bacterium]
MQTEVFENVKGILFDMDGVVHIGNSLVPGAADTINHLDSRGIPYRFLTNTTTLSPESLWRKMVDMGLPITSDVILTVHQAAATYLGRSPQQKCYLLIDANALPAYKGLPQSESHPDRIVIGDIGDRWNYTLLNDIFTMVMGGAEMVALHKGRFWQTERGLRMDIGAFVCGLEYATGVQATIIGKPAPAFFEAALHDLGLDKKAVVMIGDDIETDVGGAQMAGIRGVLVKTGKYRQDDVDRSAVEPDAVLSSITDLMEML